YNYCTRMRIAVYGKRGPLQGGGPNAVNLTETSVHLLKFKFNEKGSRDEKNDAFWNFGPVAFVDHSAVHFLHVIRWAKVRGGLAALLHLDFPGGNHPGA